MKSKKGTDSVTPRTMILGLVTAAIVLMLVQCGAGNYGNPDSPQPPGGSPTTTASLHVVNNSTYTIYYCNIALYTDTSWGPNQLGVSTIAPGASYTLSTITPGTYDLRVQTSGKLQSDSLMSVTLSSGQTYTWTITSSDFPGSGTGSASVIVQNNSSYTIYFLNATLQSDTSWGPNRLGSSTIAPGASYTLSTITPGTYDLRAQTSGKSQSDTLISITLSSGQSYTWSLYTSDFSSPNTQKATVIVQNNSSYSIYYLCYSLSSESTWGPDLLGTSTIHAGASYTISGIPAGTYDFRAQTSQKALTAIYSNVSIEAGTNFTWTLEDSSFQATTQ